MSVTEQTPDRRALPLFPNYTQAPRRLSILQWRGIRLAVFIAGLIEIALLLVRPEVGLTIFYGIAVPVLPALWIIAPGIWRNLCPLAAANQVPRLYGFTRAVTAPAWVAEHGFLIAITLFFVLASSRKWLFNDSGPATAVLLLVALVAAFVGGVALKGKSGWCSTMCPLLPVQRLYGQHALVNSPNAHCEPCLGCAKNCHDFNPHVAFLADQYDDDRTYQMRRRLFAAAFPGFITAFYVLPDPPEIAIGRMYLGFALFMAVSVGLFFTADSLLRLRVGRMTTIAAASAFTLYYWFTIAVTLDRFGVSSRLLVSVLRAVTIVLAVLWVERTFRKENAFVEVAGGGSSARPRAGSGMRRAMERDDLPASPGAEAAAVGDEVVFTHPELEDMTRVLPDVGDSLLELAEANDLPIEPGCRIGVCGADPVAILAGAENLEGIGDDEAATLDRLGLAGNTRLACVARLNGGGGCQVSLVPGAGGPIEMGPPPFTVAPDIRRVVIIGTGVAGVTAADHVRRFHPDCQVSLVGREPHLLYNRMGISRLVHGRSAMSGLFLQDERWYEDRDLKRWLNTEALRIDRDRRIVELGTGEALAYDRLILATGADSRMPDVPGIRGPGTFVMRTAEDAIAVRAWAQRTGCTHVVVAGGGLLGLEAAYALSKLNLDVTVLERGPSLLRRQLDARGGQLLEQFLTNLGIDVWTDVEIVEVLRADGVAIGVLSDGRRVVLDLLLVAAGITPAAELAVAAGLEVSGGVVVDDRMRTSDPVVFAAGDCAELAGAVSGLWPPAARQAEVAARNALGDDQVFEPKPPVTLLKVVGVDLASAGVIEAGPGEVEVVDEGAAEGRYRKLIIRDDGVVTGGIVMGHPHLSPVVTGLVGRQDVDVRPVVDALRQGRWEVLADLR